MRRKVIKYTLLNEHTGKTFGRYDSKEEARGALRRDLKINNQGAHESVGEREFEELAKSLGYCISRMWTNEIRQYDSIFS